MKPQLRKTTPAVSSPTLTSSLQKTPRKRGLILVNNVMPGKITFWCCGEQFNLPKALARALASIMLDQGYEIQAYWANKFKWATKDLDHRIVKGYRV